jgi:nitroreductase
MTLVEALGRAPALVVACMEGPPPRDPAGAATWWGSIFPAVQNLLLAARARGLGATLTTLHRAAEDEVKSILEVPAGVETVALIPVGYPEGRGFGPPRRRPADEVTFWDRWGARRPGGSPPEGSGGRPWPDGDGPV